MGDNITRKQSKNTENLSRSLHNISPEINEERLLPPSLTSSVQLKDNLVYEDPIVQTYSTDLKLESETAQMIFKDISEHKNNEVKDNKTPYHSDCHEREIEASPCKSVSVLNACQVLRLSDTSYCIRLANKQRSIRRQNRENEKTETSCPNHSTMEMQQPSNTKDESQNNVPGPNLTQQNLQNGQNVLTPKQTVSGQNLRVPGQILKEKLREKSMKKPLNKLTTCTVNHARKLSKKLQKIQKEDSSSSCDKNESSNGLKVPVTQDLDYHDPGGYEDSFPKSPSG